MFDPLLIFGYGPVPALGIEGAALASLIARLASLLLAMADLHYHMGCPWCRWPGWTTP